MYLLLKMVMFPLSCSFSGAYHFNRVHCFKINKINRFNRLNVVKSGFHHVCLHSFEQFHNLAAFWQIESLIPAAIFSEAEKNPQGHSNGRDEWNCLRQWCWGPQNNHWIEGSGILGNDMFVFFQYWCHGIKLHHQHFRGKQGVPRFQPVIN